MTSRTGRGRNRKRAREIPEPSPADVAEAQAVDRGVQTMIDGVLRDWSLDRPLRSLNRDDLRRLASAAISGWVLARCEQATCSSETTGLILDAEFAEKTSAKNRGKASRTTPTQRADAIQGKNK